MRPSEAPQRPSVRRAAAARAAFLAAIVRVEREGRLPRRLDPLGIAGALVASWAALGPSFVPRRWWMTAINVGTAQTSGYAAARLLHVAGRAARRLGPSVRPAAGDVRRATSFATGFLAVGTAFSLVTSTVRQREIADLVGSRPPTVADQVGGFAAGTAISAAALIAWRGARFAATAVGLPLRRVFPPPIAAGAGFAVVLVLSAVVSDKVVYRRLLERVSRSAAATNALLLPDRTPPVETTRSGGPASHQPWSTLGRHGQAVVADGPRASDIAAVTGKPALEPVRAYAGLLPERGLPETARAVVRELKRLGAFERSVVAVFTGTGTGWLTEWSIGAIEFLTGGDCAIASMQYTYLPSGIAFVADRDTPALAGRLLLEAVEREIALMPAERRPLLIVSGESLGAYGGHGAFANAADMLARVDGAVWVGTPRFTPLWRELVGSREAGSPEIAPVIGGGRHIRFATEPGELVVDHRGEPYGEWHHPRVVYAQHASDPIVWWSPELLTRRPAWIRERAGTDVTRAMHWFPGITFWQLATDMPRSVDVPGGHAHRYFSELVPAWAAVLGREPGPEAVAAISDAIGRLSRPH